MSDGIVIALITSLTSVVTLIITSVTNHKVKKQNDLREDMNKCQKDIEKQLKKLDSKIDDNRKKLLRNILVNDYTDLINDKEKSKEQLQDIADNFEEYKNLGGDSYVDDLHDIWKEKEIRK